MNILLTIVTSGVSSAAIIFILREWISTRLKASIGHEYDRKMEKIRADLQLQVERHKADLQIRATEHQVKFARLHDKAAETLAETFARLLALYKAIHDYLSAWNHAERPLAEKIRDMHAALRSLEDYFSPRRIFVPASVAKGVQSVIDRMVRVVNEFAIGVESAELGSDPRLKAKACRDALSVIENDIPPFLSTIEEKFRAMLGIDE